MKKIVFPLVVFSACLIAGQFSSLAFEKATPHKENISKQGKSSEEQSTAWSHPTKEGLYKKKPPAITTLTKSKEERKKIKDDFDNYDEFIPEKSDITIGGKPRKDHETISAPKKVANAITGTAAGAVGFIQQNEGLGETLENMTAFKPKRAQTEAQSRDEKYKSHMKNSATGKI